MANHKRPHDFDEGHQFSYDVDYSFSQATAHTGSIGFDEGWSQLSSDQGWPYDQSQPSSQDSLLTYGSSVEEATPSDNSDLFDLQMLAADNGVEEWADELMKETEPITLAAPLVCYGMIYRTAVQLTGDMIALDNLIKSEIQRTNAKRLKLQLLEADATFMLTLSGTRVGLLSTQLVRALKEITRKPGFDADALISAALLRDRIAVSKRAKDALVRSDIYIYGPSEHAKEIGHVLSREKVFLQKPDFPRRGTLYSNPHILQLPGFEHEDPNQYLEIPEEAGNGDNSEVGLADAVTQVYASLQRAHRLERNSGSSWLRTKLLLHQETGLSFMMQREVGPIPEQFCLWRSVLVDRDEWFIHEITKRRSRVEVDETGGGILADEMGMGKTLSILALMTNTIERAHQWASASETSEEIRKAMVPSAATLVIVPSALLINEWLHEVDKHLNQSLHTIKYHGSDRTRNIKDLSGADLVVTTYHVLITEHRRKNSPLHDIMWYRVVLDEAHIIRRQATTFYQAVYELEAKYRWCLTGTPIQNRLEDVGSLIAFLRIRPFDSLAMFRRYIAIPFNENQQQKSVAIKNLTSLLDAVSLRRTKELLHLPNRKERKHIIRFTPEERNQYEQTKQRMNRKMREHGSVEYAESKFGLFHIQLQLRILCNHGTFQDPFSWVHADARDVEEAALNMQQESSEMRCAACRQSMPILEAKHFHQNENIQCGHALCSECLEEHDPHVINGGVQSSQCPLCTVRPKKKTRPLMREEKGTDRQLQSYFRPTGQSSKMAALVQDILENLWSTKSIVFSSWTSTLDLVAKYLGEARIPYARIDGASALTMRHNVLSNMASRNDVPVLIMTTGTGAFGLNLTFANRVFIVEPQWNPSVENQAIARAQRIGQSQSVEVIRYMIENTIEQEMESQQLGKLRMAAIGNASKDRSGSSPGPAEDGSHR